MELSEKIRYLRREKGLTFEQIGNYVGVGKSTVRKWENGIIKSIGQDKIVKLATILGTTPDYLIGWENAKDECYTAFCEYLSSELITVDVADAYEAGIDMERLGSIAAGEIPLSFSEACSIADELGASLDKMTGRNFNSVNTDDERIREFVGLFSQLTTDQQTIVISQIKGILAN